MKFFVPGTNSPEEAERIYNAIADFNNCPIERRRIQALRWTHNGRPYSCAVGDPMPAYFGTGPEQVLAILDWGQCYKICTLNRGGNRGEAILAGKDHDTHATYFEV